VDIDYQACEVTKLSLLLKVLEGETEESLQRQLVAFHKERALPDLANNIKCGNSLIGPDFYQGRQRDLFDEEEMLRINAFDWQTEFDGIFSGKNPGFDAVVGNPPYISAMLLTETLHPDVKEYWKKHFDCAQGAFDIYILFIERAAEVVCDRGFISFIIPNKFLAAEYAQAFRSWVLEKLNFVSLLDLSRKKVWKASVYPVVPVFGKSGRPRSGTLSVLGPQETNGYRQIASVTTRQLSEVPDNLWSFVTQPGSELLLKCITVSNSLESLATVCGATTVAEGSEYPSLIANSEDTSIDGEKSKFVVSGSVFRYFTTWADEPVQFTGKNYHRPVISLRAPMPERRIQQDKQDRHLQSGFSAASFARRGRGIYGRVHHLRA
jgi:hypothetical protein